MATHSSVLAWRIPGTGASWAAIYGVAQSWTRLKRLSSSRALSRVLWLYSRFSLVTFFIHSIKSVYMSIPISQFIPTHLPPLVRSSLLASFQLHPCSGLQGADTCGVGWGVGLAHRITQQTPHHPASKARLVLPHTGYTEKSDCLLE